jgi:hypothetical protein
LLNFFILCLMFWIVIISSDRSESDRTMTQIEEDRRLFVKIANENQKLTV